MNNLNNQTNLSREQIDSIMALYTSGQFDNAIKRIKELNEQHPNVPLLFNILGACYKAIGEIDGALQMFEVATKIKPDYAEVHNNLGITLLQIKKIEEAIKSFKIAISHMPNFYDAYYNLGLAYKQNGQLTDAELNFRRVIEHKPDSAKAHNNLGTTLQELGQLNFAIESFNQAIIINPNYAEAFNNLGTTLKDLGQLDEANINFKKAIEVNPDFYIAYYNYGTTLIDLSRNLEAIESFKKAISINSNYPEAYNNLGIAFKGEKQTKNALKSFEKAISIKTDYAEAHNNLGLVFMNLGQMNEAQKSFETALQFKPDYAYAYNNFGSVLKQIGKFSNSIIYYKKALQINPDFFEAHNNLGNAYKYLKRHNESLDCYKTTYRIKPDADYILGNLLHSKLHLCIWDDLKNSLDEIKKYIYQNKKVVDPFPLLSLIDDPELHQKASQIYTDDKYPMNFDLPQISKYPKHQKIRIGYFSADFRIHPVANLTAELYEIHDRDQFEIHAFSFGPDTNDEMNLRIKAGVDFFHDVQSISHTEVAQLARSLELDIAIDLGGFTQDNRTGIFAMKAAPIQVNYLGYSSTMGADYMDYIIADKTLIPEDKKQYYTEKIAYLPDSFMVNDTKNKISKMNFTRKEAGLPSKGFIFSCFNHHYKITPSVFTSWMKILSKVEGSILWLSDGNETGIHNLRKEAKKHGVDSDRLFFAPRLELREDHLNRIKLANLFLDTLPYNAHATTSDALQAGLPVLTCIGESFASRVAASLINSVGLSELIVKTNKQYEKIAIDLATKPLKMKNIKDKLEKNLISSPLYDTPLYVKQIERAYLTMYKRYQEEKSPEHIYVEL